LAFEMRSLQAEGTMNISTNPALAYGVILSDSPVPKNQANISSPLETGTGSEYPFLSATDISTLERATGTTTLAQLQQVDSETLSYLNLGREQGTVTGALAPHLPTSYLTASDDLLLEKATGTTSLAAALSSSSDASSLALNIGFGREDGSLTGPISAGYLSGLLSASDQLEDAGSYGHLASAAFLKEAIAVQAQTAAASGSLDASA